IVSKFGGSSVANATQIEKVRCIVADNSKRRIVVVSAPGRSQPSEHKLTDHLINVATGGTHFRDQRINVSSEDSRQTVMTRFAQIVEDLGVDGVALLTALERDLHTDLTGERRIAFLASRGEHYSARIIADYFTLKGMAATVQLPENFGLQVSEQYLDARVIDKAFDAMELLADAESIAVIPGFYGVTAAGEVAVFSRGGSDLTGALVASAVDAVSYENWTDVSGVFEVDPRLIDRARTIPRLTFKEI